MRRPDAEELKICPGRVPRQMRAEGNDPRHIARSLRYLYARCRGLEDLLQTTDRFLRFGMPEHELVGDAAAGRSSAREWSVGRGQ